MSALLVITDEVFSHSPNLDACSPGLGLSQLSSGQLVGQLNNLSRDAPLSNSVSFAASFDPSTQTATIGQLTCNGFDNTCPWRTSNLSTLPWFQLVLNFVSINLTKNYIVKFIYLMWFN